MKHRAKRGNFILMMVSFAALTGLGYYEVAVKGSQPGIPATVSAVVLGILFLLYVTSFVTTSVDLREDALVQTINFIVKKDRKEIPFAAITRIYREPGTRPSAWCYIVESNRDSGRIRINLSLFHAPEKLCRGVIARVDKSVVEQKLWDELTLEQSPAGCKPGNRHE